MNAHPQTIAEAIQQHREAVAADEAMFDANGVCLDGEEAEITAAKEAAAFVSLCKAPCVTADDIQTKLSYVCDETVGDRDRYIDLLGCDSHGGFDVFEVFLRSMILPSEGAK